MESVGVWQAKLASFFPPEQEEVVQRGRMTVFRTQRSSEQTARTCWGGTPFPGDRSPGIQKESDNVSGGLGSSLHFAAGYSAWEGHVPLSAHVRTCLRFFPTQIFG